MENIEISVINKFNSLNNTQNSIQNTSAWIIMNKSDAKEIVKIWYKEFRKANPKKKLAFLYLANDVVQNGRKKAPQYLSVFQAVLPTTFKEAAKIGDKKTKESLLRLLKIWRERNIYKKDFLEKVKNNVIKFCEDADKKLNEPMETNEVTLHVSHRDPRIKQRNKVQSPIAKVVATTFNEKVAQATPIITNASLTDDVKLQMQKDRTTTVVKTTDLLKSMEDIQNPPSIDEITRRTIASFPADVSDPQNVPKIKYRPEALSLLEKVKKADIMLIDYNAKLDNEMKSRRQLSQLIKGWIVHQHDAIKSIKNKLQMHQTKLDKAKDLRELLNNHLSNLPDLNISSQDTESDLNPLPTLDELFN